MTTDGQVLLEILTTADAAESALATEMRWELLGMGSTESAAYVNWPTVAEIAENADLPEEEVAEAYRNVVTVWSDLEGIVDIADRVESLLAAQGGIAAVDYVLDRLMEGASLAATDENRQLTGALVRAAVLVEETGAHPLFVEFRPDERVLLARSAAMGACAQRLGDEVDTAVRKEGAVSASHAMTVLSRVVSAETQAIPRAMLLAVACQCGHQAVVSPGGAIYRRALPATEVVKHVRAALGNQASWTEEALRDLVTSLFPEAASLPPRPELDHLIATTMPGWRWSAADKAYVAGR